MLQDYASTLSLLALLRAGGPAGMGNLTDALSTDRAGTVKALINAGTAAGTSEADLATLIHLFEPDVMSPMANWSTALDMEAQIEVRQLAVSALRASETPPRDARQTYFVSLLLVGLLPSLREDPDSPKWTELETVRQRTTHKTLCQRLACACVLRFQIWLCTAALPESQTCQCPAPPSAVNQCSCWPTGVVTPTRTA
jgi:hypothetical protein